MKFLKKIFTLISYSIFSSFPMFFISCGNIVISKSELTKIENNVFNFTIKQSGKNLTRFIGTLLKKTDNKLTFVTTHHSLNFLKQKFEKQIFNIYLEQFSVKNLETELKSKFKVEYENKEKDVVIFSLVVENSLPFTITDSINFEVLKDFPNTKNSLFSLGFVTLLKEDFTPSTSKLLFYTEDKNPELDKENVFIKNIDYNQGSSGSPLFYKNKFVGLYRGKKIRNGKLTPFFRLIDLDTYNKILLIVSN